MGPPWQLSAGEAISTRVPVFGLQFQQLAGINRTISETFTGSTFDSGTCGNDSEIVLKNGTGVLQNAQMPLNQIGTYPALKGDYGS
jgi:hypothetical protein